MIDGFLCTCLTLCVVVSSRSIPESQSGPDTGGIPPQMDDLRGVHTRMSNGLGGVPPGVDKPLNPGDKPLRPDMDTGGWNPQKGPPKMMPHHLMESAMNPFRHPAEFITIEEHNSLLAPFDMELYSWDVYMHTVFTNNFARLTPDRAGRRGVLWNRHALRSKDWQITLETHIHSNGHLGGDGFGLWIIDQSDASRPRDNIDTKETSPLTGDLFGVRPDFNGIGIIFDSYDNDGLIDNPSIFVLQNNGSNTVDWDYDNDFKNSFVKSPLGGHECSLDYRNHERAKFTIRYQNGFLHVYSDLEHSHESDSKLNFQRSNPLGFPNFAHHAFIDEHNLLPDVCLSVPIELPMGSDRYHIALSAMTGQVADAHDILSLETRYLSATGHTIDDSKLHHTKYKSNRGGLFARLFWCLILLLSILLVLETIVEMQQINKVYSQQYHMVHCIGKLNEELVLSYAMHFIQFFLLIFSFHVKCIMVNLPLIVIRTQLFMTNSVKLTPFSFEKPVFWFGTTYRQWLKCQISFFVLALLYHAWRVFHV